MSRTAKQPLNLRAETIATEAVTKVSGKRHLTLEPSDAELRAMWMDHYIAAGGEIEDQDWGKAPLDEPVEQCPKTEEEKYVWYFSV